MKYISIAVLFAFPMVSPAQPTCTADNCDSLIAPDLFRQYGLWPNEIGADCNNDDLADILDLICLNNQVPRPALTPLAGQTVLSGTTLELVLTANNPNAGSLEFAVEPLPANASLDPRSGIFSFSPTIDQVGVLNLQFRVDDGYFKDTKSVPIDIVGLTRLLNTSPADGETAVAVTRETILRFNTPIDAGTIHTDSIFAEFGGQSIPIFYHQSGDGKKLTLFYQEGLPGSARVRLSIDGNLLRNELNQPVDVDQDGLPGGFAVIDFDTLGLSLIPNTAVCGRVFASEPIKAGAMDGWVNEPLADVRIRVDGMEETLYAVTDNFGDFRLEPAPSGRFFVHIDGRPAINNVPPGAYYPTVGKAWESIPGEELNVGEIFLPLVIDGTLQQVSNAEDTVIGFPDAVLDQYPELAGVSLTVPAGSLYNDDGSPGSMVGIAPVDPDRLPGRLPGGLNLPLVVTVQTDGAANFDEPAPICLPNLPDPETGNVLPPGAKTALWSFNHDISRWEIVGSMTITADGTMACSDPGSGILAPGWHGAGPGTGGDGGGSGNNCQSKQCCQEPECGCNPSIETCSCQMDDTDSNPVRTATGEKQEQVTDLHIKGVGFDFSWTRTYASRNPLNTAQGNQWDFSYNIFLEESGNGIRYCNGARRNNLYLPVTGEAETWARNGFFQEIRRDGDGVYEMMTADGKQFVFFPFDDTVLGGKLAAMIDRNGNTMAFDYDNGGRLVQITDTLGRDIDVAYNSNGFIESITDFAGRTVSYTYYGYHEEGGNYGDLKSVTRPAVTGTPNGNDFPNGKTTTYTYSTGHADARLNHNLLTITDGRRNDPDDPTFGSGPYLINVYAETLDEDDPDFDTVVRQIRGGDIVDYTYVDQEPAAADGNAVLLVIENDRVGNVTELSYDAGNRLVLKREYTGRADPDQPTTQTDNRPLGKLREEDPDFFETRYAYNIDSLPTRTIFPNGTITDRIYASDLDPAAPTLKRGNVVMIRRSPGGHTPAGDQQVIEEQFEYDTDFGCGACGFNFVTRHTDGRGNETVNTYDENGNLLSRTDRIETVVTEYRYNERGQIIQRTLPDDGSGRRRVDRLTYYDSGPQSGYLKEEIIDADHLALTTRFAYDAVGNPTRKTDPRGNDITYHVNQLDQIVRTTSQEVTPGSGIRYTVDSFYDANDNMIRRDTANLDESGNLQPNTHFTTTFEYDMLNYPVRKTEEVSDHKVVVETYAYDGKRNRILTRYGEAVAGRQPENVLEVRYDERDLVFQEIRAPGSPDQATVQYDYDSNGNLIRRIEGLEAGPHTHHYTYDGYNRRIVSLDPMGNQTQFQYDANHNVIRERVLGELIDVPGDAGNRLLSDNSRVYDAMNRLIRRETAFFDTESGETYGDGLVVTQFVWNDDSQIVRTVNDNGHQSTTAYDTANRKHVVTDAANNTITFTYDPNGNVTRIDELEKSDLGSPDQHFATTFGYDGLNRLASTTDNIGNVNRRGYDSRDNLTLQIDARGNVIRHEYDGLNRQIRTIRQMTDSGDGSGNLTGTITTSQTWDDSSRLTGQTDDNGNTTAYTYDGLNRKIATTYADGTVHTTSYDAHHNAVRKTDANGNVVTASFDELDRLIRKDIVPGPGVSDDTTFENYSYDGLSRLVAAEDDDSLVTRAYDSLSRVTREVLNGRATNSVFDGVGNKIQCIYPSGRTITTTYDALERKKTISDENGMIATYYYIGPERVERREYGNGTRSEWTYDGITGVPNPPGDFGVKRIIRTRHTRIADDSVLDDRVYTWDAMNNKTRRQDIRVGGPQLTHDYHYDSVNRLIRSDKYPPGGPVDTITYELDGVGNRIRVTGGDQPGEYTMDATLPEPGDFQMNQYTATSVKALIYDANGNLKRTNSGLPEQRDTIYNYNNLMVEFTRNENGHGQEYAYDALGRRITIKTNTDSTSEEVNFYYSSRQVIEEENPNKLPHKSFAYGLYIDEPLNIKEASSAIYLYADNNYSTVLTLSNKDLESRFEYSDYGQLFLPNSITISSHTSINPYLFSGRRYDLDTRFYYYRSRYMSPSLGRFTTPDMLGTWYDRNNIGNSFSFVNSNPLSSLDPFGYSCINCTDSLNRCLENIGRYLRDAEVNRESGESITQNMIENGYSLCERLFDTGFRQFACKRSIDLISGEMYSLVWAKYLFEKFIGELMLMEGRRECYRKYHECKQH